MINFDEIPDNFKLRLPKSLYYELSKQAEVEDVSLNQYCVYLLAKGVEHQLQQHLGKVRLNELLLSIRNRAAGSVPRMLDEIQALAERVDSLKAPLFYELQRVRGKKGIPEREMNHLENIYPVLTGDAFSTVLPKLKMPSAKIVIDPGESRFYELRSDYEAIVASVPRALMTEVYVDEISDRGGLVLPDEAALHCKVIYFLSDDFTQTRADIETLMEKLKALFMKEKVQLRVEPTYLFVSIEQDFQKYLSKIE